MSNDLQVSNPTTQGDVNQAVSLVVQDKLQRAGITDQTLSELKAELDDLSKIEVVDEASFKLIHGGTMKATSARTTITKICKAGREYAISEQKAWIAAERDTISSFSAQEAALKAKKDGWIAHKERIEREAMEARERAIKSRFVAIEALGWQRKTQSDGEDTYELGGSVLKTTDISMAVDEGWDNILRSAMAVSEEVEAKREAERIAAEEAAKQAEQEAERIRLAQEAIEEGARKLKEQQDAFNAKINEARRAQLITAGGIWQIDMPMEADLSKMDEAEFELLLVRVAENEKARKEQKVKEQAAAARERLIAERVKALKEAGWEEQRHDEGQRPTLHLKIGDEETVFYDFTFADMEEKLYGDYVALGKAELARRKKVEEERIAAEAVEKERIRVQQEAERAAEEERIRAAELDDAGRIEELAKAVVVTSALLAETLSLCSSSIAKQGIKKALEHMGNAGTVLGGTLKDLK